MLRLTSAALFALLLTPVPASAGLSLNGPALDGRNLASDTRLIGGQPIADEAASGCPTWGCGTNGPALDGRTQTSDTPLIGGQPIGQEAGSCPAWACGSNGPALDGHNVEVPGGTVIAVGSK